MQNPVGYDAMGVPISFNSVGFNSVAARWTPDHPNFGGNINKAAFASAVSDFYLTNPVARASAIMAECSALANTAAKTAAE